MRETPGRVPEGMRSCYLEYPDLLEIRHAVRDQLASASKESEPTMRHAARDVLASGPEREWALGKLHAALSRTHYRTLLKVARQEARNFYFHLPTEETLRTELKRELESLPSSRTES